MFNPEVAIGVPDNLFYIGDSIGVINSIEVITQD